MKNVLASLFVAASLAGSLAHANDLAYYQQFPYTNTDDADGNKTYRFMMQTGNLMGLEIGKIQLGTVFATMMFALNADGTFSLVYNENTEKFFPVDMHEMFKGNWTVPADQLILGDIAVGTRAVYDGRNAIQLTFVKDLHTPGLKGKSVVFDYGYSNAAIDAFGFPGFPPVPGMPQ